MTTFYDALIVLCPACGKDRELQYQSSCPVCQKYHAQREALVQTLLATLQGEDR